MFGGPQKRAKRNKGKPRYTVINGVAYPVGSKRRGVKKRYSDPLANYIPDNINQNLAAQNNYYRLPSTRTVRPTMPRTQRRHNMAPFSAQTESQIDLKEAYEGGRQAYAAGKAGLTRLKNRIQEHRGKRLRETKPDNEKNERDSKREMEKAAARAEFVRRYTKKP